MAYKMVDYEGHGYVTLKELDATTQDPVFRVHAGDHTQEAIEGSMKKKPEVDYGFGRKQELPATRSAEALAGNRRTLGGFCHTLEQKYGNLVRAWRFLGAAAGDQLTWEQFVDGLKREGFRGHVDRHGDLWHEMKMKAEGKVTLREFAPQTWEELQRFLSFLETSSAGLEAAWATICGGKDSKGMDKTVGKYLFCQALEKMGFTGNSGAIFGWLDIENKGKLDSTWIELMPRVSHGKQQTQYATPGYEAVLH